MNKEMIVTSNGHQTMVAILEDDLVSEVFIERERQRGVVGNVSKGRVSKVLPGMQSAFVDIGLGRDGFLYVSDVVNTLEEFERLESGDAEEEGEERGGRESADQPKIRERLRPLLQIPFRFENLGSHITLYQPDRDTADARRRY